ncbi:MAG: peptidylprolyl isomerase [Bacteroidales bacterium]|nr:peptidylprolyl isomerase [Bacteroidales bacterium]
MKRSSIILLLVMSLFQFRTSAQDTIIDGIVAIVGGHMILKSDLETQYLQYRAQGNITGSPQRVKCQIFENMLFMKLLYHQSEVDSLTVTDSQVESEMDRRMRYFITQAGSPERLEEYYHKSLLEIKADMRDVIKEQMMVEQEQNKITEKVVVTPAEVKAFFRKIPKDSIPEISAEVEIGIITREPEITDVERGAARDQLAGFKDRITKGDDFATLAILYSEDPGSAKQGGELGMFQRGDMRPQFEAAAFKLKPGEVSDIVETEDGFHLIQMIERRGDFVNVRHILVQPKVSPIELNNAKLFLDSIADLIQTGKIMFDEAVVKYSDDPNKNNKGMLVNPASGTTRFEIGEVDPKIFFVIDKLKEGEISSPVKWEERGKRLFRIYYLVSRTAPHYANLDIDYARIQQWTLDKKKLAVIEKWIDQKAKETYVEVMLPYRDCEFERQWVKIGNPNY